MSSEVSLLEQLKTMTVVVADTGDFETMRAYLPRDATTNPSLIYKAVLQPQYAPLLDEALAYTRQLSSSRRLEAIMDRLLINFGWQILQIIPGRVSTEVDARLSFDTAATIAKACHLIALYQERGISRERVLIKIASTWEGLQAARVLEAQGIHVNMTLLFSLAQAMVAAEVRATLISPFVGRILDWYKKETGKDYEPCDDPGVLSVKNIYQTYKRHGIPTEVMGASFRNIGEIIELAGCDLLTISPHLLDELSKTKGRLERKLQPVVEEFTPPPVAMEEKTFRWQLNEDAMATSKLAEGIRLFAADTRKLEQAILAKL